MTISDMRVFCIQRSERSSLYKPLKNMKTETEKEEARLRLNEILCEVAELGYEASELVSELSKSAHRNGEAYGAFDLGCSTNPYDTTLETIVESITNNN